MPMPLLALRPKHPSDGVTLCASAMRAAAGAEAPPFPVRRHLFPSLIRLLLVGILVGGHLAPAHAQSAVAPSGMLGPLPPIDCSTVSCEALDQRTLLGNQMFDEQNFAPIVDGFGRVRRFYVHLPAIYDVVDGTTQKVPLLFTFHGGSQAPEAMIVGKWEEYFDQDYAFVIPFGEADPCDNPGGNGKSHWMQTGMALRTSPGDAHCDPATAVINGAGQTVTYWNAALPGTFTDVLFVEELRAMLLARFPKLNANKVYATGFSSGGGMTYMLACYRASLFKGFSVVAKTLGGDSARGDYNNDGIIDLDPASLVATCGKNALAAGYATGIVAPQLWGIGVMSSPFGPLPVVRRRPFALFVGNQDNTMQEINDTGAFIRDKNNLGGGFVVQNPFLDVAMDQATTQRRTFTTAANGLGAAPFRRFLVEGVVGVSGTHAMPDAEECGAGHYFMTCDYSYTTQTQTFFEEHADLNLNP